VDCLATDNLDLTRWLQNECIYGVVHRVTDEWAESRCSVLTSRAQTTSQTWRPNASSTLCFAEVSSTRTGFRVRSRGSYPHKCWPWSLFVCNVGALYSVSWIFTQYFAPYCSLDIWLGCEEYRAQILATNPFPRGIAMYKKVWQNRDFRSIFRFISETIQDMQPWSLSTIMLLWHSFLLLLLLLLLYGHS